jgi:hypothetical protein
MKDKSGIAVEHQFISDVVDATLEGYELSFDHDVEIRTPEEGSTWKNSALWTE